MSDSLRPSGLQPARLLCPWDSPGKNTGVGCHALLQGIFKSVGTDGGVNNVPRTIGYLVGKINPFLAYVIYKQI